ncbi:hypothetical protein SEVIR_5G407000v4 [Setaria viridis]|uniref:Uncharacterized protein n=1 Tax=Setaria viridis TaxID=4556 RepID=A0A4U6V2U7_SETVI|nr:uncharacterized protein LOC117857066 [Setaria viridis]TKW18027.1 hypothetical protein SEVIR_5G407000v2 [Setaria viridis]TKW18028.1 hypothetical protein SEVIR_5G407000v2 [Setaria viridis]TKW18029.1 hypothetical protein SEVIR_5G407000v2 [Setaria viridis]
MAEQLTWDLPQAPGAASRRHPRAVAATVSSGERGAASRRPPPPSLRRSTSASPSHRFAAASIDQLPVLLPLPIWRQKQQGGEDHASANRMQGLSIEESVCNAMAATAEFGLHRLWPLGQVQGQGVAFSS